MTKNPERIALDLARFEAIRRKSLGQPNLIDETEEVLKRLNGRTSERFNAMADELEKIGRK